MNPSYDPPNSGYPSNGGAGRARVPAPADDHEVGYGQSGRGYSEDGYDDYEPGSRSTASSPSGRASVAGSARVPGAPAGRASVRSSGYDDDYDYPGSSSGTGAVTGRASVGRASVGTAPVSPAAGRASVGRARVGTPDDLDPDGPRRGGRGPGGRGPGGPGDGDDADAGPPKKKRRRARTWILSAVAAFIMLSGLVVVFGAYQFNGVPTPKDYTPPQSTTIYYSDGKTPMAKLGDQNRTLVTLAQVSEWVPWAVVATEDMSFYSNSGVSFRGIARAAWNNLKGGDTQGGSTISQQYMRQTLTDDPSKRTVKVKIQEALGAIKLDEKYTKPQIMEMYLNVIYFGRGAYGIEAASQAYFNKPSKNLTLEESMVLADLIKDPGSGIYDPAKNLASAQTRWGYTRDNLVKLKKITKAQADAMKYPTTFTKPDPNKDLGQFGQDLPTGLVVHHVMDELSHMKDAKGNDRFPNLKDGGYQITTTISKTLQDAAFRYASVNGADSEIKKQAVNPAIVQAGVVSVDPNTGEVLAYYGGDRGDGNDYSGVYRDPILSPPTPDGKPDDSWSGLHHSPGSSMKIYTLGAAIKAGISIDSYWLGPPKRTFPGRATPVRNAESAQTWANGTTLVTALQMSLNTVYYAVGLKVGADKVIDMAHAMGINHIWNQDDKRVDLDTGQGDPGQLAKDAGIGTEVAIGQFGITVLDHANGVATIASGGIYRPAHFVKSATGPDGFKYAAPSPAHSLADQGIMTSQQSTDLRWAMEQVLAPGAGNGYSGLRPNGWDAGGKSGTWETNANSTHNADGWFVGFTPKLATAVWVGNVKDRLDIMLKNGSKPKDLAGANLSGSIFRDVMTAGLKVVGQTTNQKIQVPGSTTGDPSAGETSSPMPTAPPTTPDQPGNGPGNGNNPCNIPMLCPSNTPTQPGGPGNNKTPTPTPTATRTR